MRRLPHLKKFAGEIAVDSTQMSALVRALQGGTRRMRNGQGRLSGMAEADRLGDRNAATQKRRKADGDTGETRLYIPGWPRGEGRSRHQGLALRLTTLLLAVMARPSSTEAQTFTLTDLGTFGGPYALARGINDAGEVVGSADAYGSYAEHVFLYSGGAMMDLAAGVAYGINDAGQVVGVATTNGNAPVHPFLYSGGVMTDLSNTLGGGSSEPYGINDLGQIVGVTSGSGHSHAFLYSGGVMTDLGTLGGSYSVAYAINAVGQVVGRSAIADDIAEHAFLYSEGTMRDLGTLGGTYSAAYGINSAGQVVGQAATVGGRYAFLYSGGVMRDLGAIGGRRESGAYAINDAGQVVGYASAPGLVAFLYSGGSMIDLNDRIPAGVGLALQEARAINNTGQIVGAGYIGSYNYRDAFLLIPASTTSTSSTTTTTTPVTTTTTSTTTTATATSTTTTSLTTTTLVPVTTTTAPTTTTIATITSTTTTTMASGSTSTSTTTQTTSTTLSPSTTTTTAASGTTTTSTLPGCLPSPQTGCQPAAAQGSSVSLRQGSTNMLVWKWKSNAAVAKADFGSPTSTSDYLLCVYDATGGTALQVHARMPAGTNWREGSSGFKYQSKALVPDGILKALLRAGGPGQARESVKGRGPNLALPSGKLTPPVRVQLLHTGGSVCWEATYSTPIVSFKAKSD